MRKNTITIAMKAVDHAFFNHKHPKTGKSLAEEGVLEYARAPREFEPDVQRLARDVGSIAALANAIEGFDASQMRILMSVLNSSHRLIAHGLRFGEVVFKNLSTGHDYLDCWFRCYVLDLGPQIDHQQYIRVTGSLDDIHGTLMMVPIESVLDRKAFGLHRKRLISQGKVTAPESVRKRYLTHSKPRASFEDFPSLTEIASKLVDSEGNPAVRSARRDTRKQTRRQTRRSGSTATYEVV